MSEGPVISPARTANSPALPGWVGAWCGLWLLHWRSQLTVRQLPARIGTLLVLPFLVYVTLYSADYAQRESREFLGRLKHDQIPITPEAGLVIRRILVEEMKQDEKSWQLRPGESAGEKIPH